MGLRKPEVGQRKCRVDARHDAVLVELERLAAARRDAGLRELWNSRDDIVWAEDQRLYLMLGKALASTDRLAAYDVFTAALEHFPDDIDLRYSQARTLADMGVPESALERVTALIATMKLRARPSVGTNHLSSIHALRARVHKDLAADSTGASRTRHLRQALADYAKAYKCAPRGRKSHRAINAATMALLLGDLDRSRNLAREAAQHAESEYPLAGADSHWRLAVRGEAALIEGNVDEAARWYGQAVALTGDRYVDITAMRRNAKLIAAQSDRDIGWIGTLLHIPRVVVFSGHMIDSPGRRRRFPPEIAEDLRAELRERLTSLDAGFGYAGAACGSDLLFLEAMREREKETHVILPFAEEQFLETSVRFAEGGAWVPRFDAAMCAATTTMALSGAPSEWGGVAFEYVNLVLLGSALLRSTELETELVGLAVWDGGPGYGAGGTKWTVEAWQKKGIPVETLRLDDILNRHGNARTHG